MTVKEPRILLEIGFESEKQIEQYMVDLCEAGLADIPQFRFKGVGPEFLDRVNARVKYAPTMPAPVDLMISDASKYKQFVKKLKKTGLLQKYGVNIVNESFEESVKEL